jgi:DNA-binding CsgD family transcriptional regulator
MTPGRGEPYTYLDDVDVFEVKVGDETLVVVSLPTEDLRTLDGLTAAEREVARAVIRGLSNEEVARARGCRPRTIACQLAAVYKKLGVTSRSELAALVRAPRSPRGGDQGEPPPGRR